ncbi:PP2C family protein-serine/threonine phosphatase [Niveispirillum fermenti]|uniref:PP2C family protein-serine/threonine phosphatase n=1 Tax=Niveispirillum fermenti TaxID=1233113 RepID=UPI003A8A0410
MTMAPPDGGSGPRRISFPDCRILIVDDSRFNREILTRFMQWVGVGRIDSAGNGEEGLALLRAGNYDLVLLDIDMPVMDGLTLCRHIRQEPAWADLPVLMQTSPAGDPAGVKCFEAGASDIVTKPINPGECMARVRLHLEKQFFLRNLTDFHKRLQNDLKLARSMQKSLIPDARTLAAAGLRHGLSIEGHFEPSDELGGDFWTLFDLGGDRLGVLSADFSGHGISAAINTFRLHTLIERIPPQGFDAAEWLTMLNRPLKDLLPVGQFATCFYAIIDAGEGTLSYAAAGAPGPMLFQDGQVDMLDASGVMLGVSNNPFLTADTVPFPRGSSLLIYSDAMTEAEDRQGHLVGEGGLQALVRQTFPGGENRLARLLAAFDTMVTRPLADDLTAICISRV